MKGGNLNYVRCSSSTYFTKKRNIERQSSEIKHSFRAEILEIV